MGRWVSVVLGAGLLASCRTVPPEQGRSPVVAAPGPVGERRVGELNTALAKTAAVEIVVEGANGMVVLNRQPVGLAPRVVEVPVTEQGFLATPVSVGVRFVAKDVSEASYSVEEVLRVTDRPPAQIVFGRDGVHRVFAGAK